VIVNGQRINSCLTLAVMHAGDEITTIEGLEIDGDLHPMQAAFVRHDGLQCGYCTPGQICSAIALLEEHKAGWPSYATADVATAPVLTEAEIAERMSGALLQFLRGPHRERRKHTPSCRQILSLISRADTWFEGRSNLVHLFRQA
jgi:aerobic-type carbon monoxide dehydrogenase small subunit (CoxS/CutS family)